MVVVSSSFSPPEEGILFHSPETKLVVDGKEVGTGALYITESNVLWGGGINTEGAPVSTVSLLYPNISMHALQREPFASLMILVNYELRLPEIPSTQDKEDAGSDSDDYEPYETPTTELRFLPPNEQDVVGMYSAMCQGQDLHPDMTEDMHEDDDYMDGEDSDGNDDDDEEFEDAEESNAAPDDAAARLRQMRLENGNQNGESSDG